MIIDSNADKEYAGITGLPDFCKYVAALAFGSESPAIAAKRVSAAQVNGCVCSKRDHSMMRCISDVCILVRLYCYAVFIFVLCNHTKPHDHLQRNLHQSSMSPFLKYLVT